MAGVTPVADAQLLVPHLVGLPLTDAYDVVGERPGLTLTVRTSGARVDVRAASGRITVIVREGRVIDAWSGDCVRG